MGPMDARKGYVVHEAVLTGSIVVTAVVALGFGIAAISTPNWHYTDNTVAHIRRGLFETCSVEMVSGAQRYFCRSHDFGAFCGHEPADVQNRFTWPAILGVLSVIALTVIPLGATFSWLFYRPRPRTLMAVCTTSLALMLMACSVFVHTIDAWYFCGEEFCSYTRRELLNANELCLSGLGYSFILAMLYCGTLVLEMFLCGLYARWVRLGIVVDSDALRRAAKTQRDKTDPFSGGAADAPDSDAVGGVSSAAALDIAASASVTSAFRSEDWVMDDEVGMYWSAQHGLYLDPNWNVFYDPQTNCWHDPESDEWRPLPPSRW